MSDCFIQDAMDANNPREDANMVMQKVLGHLDQVVEHVRNSSFSALDNILTGSSYVIRTRMKPPTKLLSPACQLSRHSMTQLRHGTSKSST